MQGERVEGKGSIAERLSHKMTTSPPPPSAEACLSCPSFFFSFFEAEGRISNFQLDM